MEIIFALCSGFCLFLLHQKILRPYRQALLDSNLYHLAVCIFSLKLFLALTMGHLDITRFIIFVQNFVRHPMVNPWDYNPPFPSADFPYPPLLLYLHAFFFFIFKPLLSYSAETDPIGFAYTIFKIPFVLADLILLQQLLALYSSDGKEFKKMMLCYLGCGVLLFHQYYSGQLDLIAAIPFFLSVLEIEKNRALTFKAFILLCLSLCFKPFALIFFPVIFLRIVQLRKLYRINSWRAFLRDFAMLCITFLVFKFSEMPFLFTSSYQSKMGAGAIVFFQPGPFVDIILFPFFYCAYLIFFSIFAFFQLYEVRIYIHIVCITLLVAVSVFHSAGWMIWACLGVFFGFNFFMKNRVNIFFWWCWNISFIARWAVVEHSPVADSFSIFITKFLKLSSALPMGFVFKYFSKTYDQAFALSLVECTHFLFMLISALAFFSLVVQVLYENYRLYVKNNSGQGVFS